MREYLFPAKTKTSRVFVLGLGYKDSVVCFLIALPIAGLMYLIVNYYSKYSLPFIVFLGILVVILLFVLFNTFLFLQNDRRLWMRKKARWNFKKEQFFRGKE